MIKLTWAIWIIMALIILLQYEKNVALKDKIKKLERQTVSFYDDAQRSAREVKRYYHALKEKYAPQLKGCAREIFIDEYIDDLNNNFIYGLMVDRKQDEYEFVCEELLPRVEIHLTSGEYCAAPGELSGTGQALYELWRQLAGVKYRKYQGILAEKTKEIESRIGLA